MATRRKEAEISVSEWKGVVERFVMQLRRYGVKIFIMFFLKFYFLAKMQKRSTLNQETEKLHDYATGKLSHLVLESQGCRVFATQTSLCEWRHLKTYAESLSRGVFQSLRDSSFTVLIDAVGGQCVRR